jgi:glutamate decarboxylase
VRRINLILNDLNIELHKALREEDNSFVSRTMMDSPRYYYQNVVVLRSITINPLTTTEILKEIIEQQERLGVIIYKKDFTRCLEQLEAGFLSFFHADADKRVHTAGGGG